MKEWYEAILFLARSTDKHKAKHTCIQLLISFNTCCFHCWIWIRSKYDLNWRRNFTNHVFVFVSSTSELLLNLELLLSAKTNTSNDNSWEFLNKIVACKYSSSMFVNIEIVQLLSMMSCIKFVIKFYQRDTLRISFVHKLY